METKLSDANVLTSPLLRPQQHTIASPLALPAQPSPSPQSITIGAALALARQCPRASLPFRAVNRPEKPGHDPGMQRHHLLPRQLLSRRCFGPLFDEIGRVRIGFDDFRSNGLLLPANTTAALRIGLPMHRGPHRDYNALVLERVGQVESSWSALRLRAPEIALDEAVLRLKLLQKALRRRLLDPGRKRFALSRFDPLGREADFTEMDAMVDALWPDTETAIAAPELFAPELALIQSSAGPAQMAARATSSAFAF